MIENHAPPQNVSSTLSLQTQPRMGSAHRKPTPPSALSPHSSSDIVTLFRAGMHSLSSSEALNLCTQIASTYNQARRKKYVPRLTVRAALGPRADVLATGFAVFGWRGYESVFRYRFKCIGRRGTYCIARRWAGASSPSSSTTRSHMGRWDWSTR